MAKNLFVQRIPKKKAYLETCNEGNALFEALENDPKLLSHQEESKMTPGTCDASSEPSTSQKAGECQLQIQRVYSLFNDGHFDKS